MVGLCAAALMLLLGCVTGGGGSDCGKGAPADAFSERIGALLGEIEGPDFPSSQNLEGWRQRQGAIREGFGRILDLTVGNGERRRATVHALVAAESLSAPESQAHMLGTGLEPGEARAWARRVLKQNATMVNVADHGFVDSSLISGLLEAWADQDATHVERSLPFYQEKAAELRALASFGAPSCSS